MSTEIADQVSALADRIAGLSPQTVTRPVLVYFDMVGIAWPIRCLLHLKGVDYEHIAISAPAWFHLSPEGRPLLRESFRNGHVPLYVDADVYLTQSNVILTYLAEKHDLMGDTPAERLAVMDVMAHAYDALFHWSGLFQVNVRMFTPEDVVEPRLRAFMGEGMWGVLGDGYRRNLDAFQRYLDSNPDQSGGFMVGSRLSAADLHAFNVLCNWYKAFDRERFVERYPRLDDYIDRIAAIPEVTDYIRHHQERTVWFPLPDLALRLTSPDDLAGLTPAL